MAELKHSRQRDYIRENLRHRTDHPTADMIYEDIRKGYPRISLGTVYRNLTLLAELGEIRKLTGLSGPEHFDGRVFPHNHFICRKCGKIIDLEGFDSSDLIRDAEKKAAVSVDSCNVYFYGYCRECRDAEDVSE